MPALVFFMGVAFFYLKSAYCLLFILGSFFLRPRFKPIIWFLVALIWCGLHQWKQQGQGLPDVRVLPKATIEGKITAIPSPTQFQWAISKYNGQPVKAIGLMRCYQDCPQMKIDEEWRVLAKLKKPVNLGNPGHFDYVGGLRARHIQWVGTMQGKTAECLYRSKNLRSCLALRNHLAKKLASFMPTGQSLGIVQALTLGLSENISKTQWDLFRRTGTTHLMVISGAHIGLVASLSFGFIYWLWTRHSRLSLYFPAARAASIIAFLMAAGYALLAGFAPSTQRALVACFCLFLKNFINRSISGWQAWRYSLLLVLLIEPHVVLLPGFYLSFIAVTCLFLGNQWLVVQGLRKSLCLQMACLIGMMPLTLFWFAYGAVDGLLANMIAIPWVGFVLVPLALLGLFLVSFLNYAKPLCLIDWAVQALMRYLNAVDSLALINLNVKLVCFSSVLALSLAGLLIFFLPIRTIVFPSLLLLQLGLFPGFARPKWGEAWIRVLDVGQGLAVVVTTAEHNLIYDAGGKFFQGSDMGKIAIIPFLTTMGIRTLDKVVISHPDLDHRGGLQSLEERYPIKQLLVNDTKFYGKGENCHHQPDWVWDDVHFHFFAIDTNFKDKNNRSCVLEIHTAAGSILLPGDIEAPAEKYLVAKYASSLHADVLLLAHHGSKTSSSLSFIQAVNPRMAFIASGLDNRFHFPHQQTLKTLTKQRIPWLNTADCGMISLDLLNRGDKDKVNVDCYRGACSICLKLNACCKAGKQTEDS